MSLMVCPSTPAAPAFAFTSRHALRKMSSRVTLSKSAWNRRAALAFAARYSARWSCRVLSLMWLALTGIHPRLPPPDTSTKYGPFPPRALPRFFGTMGHSDSRSALAHFAGAPLIGSVAPSPPSRVGFRTVSLLGRRRASPVPTTNLPPFHVPYAAGFFGAAFPSASPLPWPSPHRAGLGSRLLPFVHCISTRQTSLDAADWWVAPSLKKARPHASTPGSLHTSVGCYEGVLVPPSAGLAPVSRREPQDAPRLQHRASVACRQPQRPVLPTDSTDDRQSGPSLRMPLSLVPKIGPLTRYRMRYGRKAASRHKYFE